ncbi:aspartyl-phosphate phosphatase Spo0E family protein [Jeotgalibacillus soli]
MTKNNTFTSECVLKVSHELDTLILKVQKLYVGGER